MGLCHLTTQLGPVAQFAVLWFLLLSPWEQFQAAVLLWKVTFSL